MTEFVRFGTPDLIEIAARWTADLQPRDQLPLEGGWSTGDLRITVGHQLLTDRKFNDTGCSHASWYLAPVLEWLIRQWTWLFHEEAYSWSERSGAPAALATFLALGRSIASSDELEREDYRSVQAWWMRHALRSADSSALYPDIFFRRLSDSIEVSWLGRQPVHAPEGFTIPVSPGYATFAVDAVATPLWKFLEWGLKTAPASEPGDRQYIADLRQRFQQLKKTPLKDLELRHLGVRLQDLLEAARSAVNFEDSCSLVKGIPVIASFDSAVLMFGGLNPSISQRDAIRLMQFIAKHQNGSETEALAQLVDDRASNPSLAPHEEGYELAEEVRAELAIPNAQATVNVRALLLNLKIDVEEVPLETDSIRGVAIAGRGISPAILVNMSHSFNKTWEGRRFTLAHELCHILFDRSRAKKLSHVSGPWTSPRTEKRANAFAAMFLASRAAVRRSFSRPDAAAVKTLANELQIGFSSLVEHLYNIGLISDTEREVLRTPEGA